MEKILQFYFKKLIRKSFLFNKISKELVKSQYMSENELESLQNLKLQKLIHHSYKHVPFYKDLLNSLNLKPEDINTKKDLEKLPYIDKLTVKENFDKFVSKMKPKFLYNVGYTSGSKGTPGEFLRDFYSINFENAVIWRQWLAAGDCGLKRLTLRGDVIVPVTQTEPPFWQYNSADKELSMSSYHLSDKYSQAYLDKILEFKPDILYAYPSTANLLANLFEKNSIDYKFKVIFTSSETLSSSQKIYIERIFNTQIYDWYGQAERVVGIGQCKCGTYHINEDYSIVELISIKGGFEPVGTNLVNYLMPLIRYKTDDKIILSEEVCQCGSHFRAVKEILGRNDDYLVTPEGSIILFTICNYIPLNVNNIIETQFYQDKQGEVIINLVVSDKFNKTDEQLLINNTIEHTSPMMVIKVNIVDNIARSANGKFKSVINKIA